MALLLGAAAGLATADEAWMARVDAAVAGVEKTVGELDGKKTEPEIVAKGATARIAALDVRLRALETSAGLATGTIGGKDGLSGWTTDIATLTTRARAVIAAKAPAPKDPPPLKTDDAPKPKPPPKKDWPAELEFSIGAKVDWQENGSWLPVKIDEYLYENRFFCDGYTATFGFNLGAKNLLRDIKSATIRVVARMEAPLAGTSTDFRTYEVTWTGDKGFGNESFKRYWKFDTFVVSASQQMKMTRDSGKFVPQAWAHVLSITDLQGNVRTFNAPTYDKK